MAIFSPKIRVIECLCGLYILSTVTTQARLLPGMNHKHHRGEPKLLEEMELNTDMLEELAVMKNLGRHIQGHSRHRSPLDASDESSEELTDDDQLPEEPVALRLPTSSSRLHRVRKRHNSGEDNVAYQIMSEDDEVNYKKSRARLIHHHRHGLGRMMTKRFEVEVKEAQNSSLCNYTVIDIPDPSFDNSRTPQKLVNVMCNHAGSTCRHPGTYCCIQTYSNIQVSYGDGTTEMIKVYTGCVCSLQLYGELQQYKPRLAIND